MADRPRALRAAAALSSFAALVGCAIAPTAPGAWRACDTGTDASLRGLAAVSADVAYVGGSGGTLLRTTDGGRTWTDVAPPDSGDCDFRDVEALDRDRVLAMVAGQPARLYRTTDGGASWSIVHEDPRPEAFFDAVAFDGEVGVLFGDAIDGRFALLASGDGGATWAPAVADALPPAGDGEAGFAASGTCVVARDPGRGMQLFTLVTGGGPTRYVAFRPDGGHVAADLPLAAGLASGGAFSIAWRGRLGVAVGGDYQAPDRRDGTGAVSNDGGVLWRPVDVGGYRSAVCWLADGGLLAVGSHGASWSGDEGATWQPFGDRGFHAVARAADGAVWACGSDGRVARLGFGE